MAKCGPRAYSPTAIMHPELRVAAGMRNLRVPDSGDHRAAVRATPVRGDPVASHAETISLDQHSTAARAAGVFQAREFPWQVAGIHEAQPRIPPDLRGALQRPGGRMRRRQHLIILVKSRDVPRNIE